MSMQALLYIADDLLQRPFYVAIYNSLITQANSAREESLSRWIAYDELQQYLESLVQGCRDFIATECQRQGIQLPFSCSPPANARERLNFLSAAYAAWLVQKDIVRWEDVPEQLRLQSAGRSAEKIAAQCLPRQVDRPPEPTREWCCLSPNRIRWIGEPEEIDQRLWHLLCYLLDHGEKIPFDPVEEMLYEDCEYPTKALQNDVSDLKPQLRAIGFPWIYRTKSGFILRSSDA
jgi:hypothetical protein